MQAKLQEFLGREDLDRHLDSDEAIVLGAALHAANLSDGIKLNRKLGMIDGSSYGVVIELDGPDLSKDESTRQLVHRMKKLPSKVNHMVIGIYFTRHEKSKSKFDKFYVFIFANYGMFAWLTDDQIRYT